MYAATRCPLDAHGRTLDETALARHLDEVASVRGIVGLLVNGHTGENHAQHSHSDFTLFEGRQATRRVKKVMLHGQWLVDDGAWVGTTECGRFVARYELGTGG
ncbi:hypothetical protein WL14_03495 [Burkholderia cepacia]|nr:hypothetical protein WL14_03495 [Burkholderia cepacia]